MMDRKEAADLLDNLIGMVEDSHGADYDTALKMGIEALSTSGYGSEPVDDTISRQAAIDALDGNVIVTSKESAQAVMDYIRGCADKIRSLPSAQPELIEKAAYIRGFEQGRTQGMIDSQGGKK